MLPERSLIGVINHLLSRQPSLRDKLRPHAGKVACLDVSLTQFKLSVATDGLLQLAVIEPNVTITVQPANIPRILSDMDRAFSYVTISGDADFARTISELANELRWDLEEELAPWVGDIAAVRMAEYWLEENPTLLYRHAGDDFAAEVARLRDDVERMSKRIEQIERRARTGAA